MWQVFRQVANDSGTEFSYIAVSDKTENYEAAAMAVGALTKWNDGSLYILKKVYGPR